MSLLHQTKFPAHIFRAYDIRGKLEHLTPATIAAIATALARLYIKKQVKQLVLGYDARLTSPSYAAIFETILIQHGIDVIALGCCSTPMMYFFSGQYAGNGIMITASHNPKTDNGVKWVCHAEPPSPEQIQALALDAAQISQSMNSASVSEVTHQFYPVFAKQYLDYLQQDIQLKRPLKIIVDGLHGSAGQYAIEILMRLGCQWTALNCEANGHFPKHAPDPSKDHHLIELKNQVIEQQADLGFALDGDGDRVVIVDDLGQIISADRLLCLFAQICLLRHPQHEIVFDVKCSNQVTQFVAAHQGIATMIRTGSTFLRKYIAQSKQQVVFGGEYAGHYVFNDGRGRGYDDGLYAALRVLEYLSEHTQPLSQLMQHIPQRFSTQDCYISTHQHASKALLSLIEENCHSMQAKLTQIDGVRLDFEDGFGIIRASNTGEYLTVRFDADTAPRLEQIRQNFAAIFNSDYPDIAQEIRQAY
ncbi:phosphomannomutase/phosphoglucomutase [Acinetobacter sp. MD2(2019)]|uniref:phosphomannomutase/phosphoglucomutase n=1 Tax=Acinetobacter sp. MD2(2019) TaxID=2605273 RepID=UPI002D1F56B6|nr:phosphomannomutase/phosphoglucomutase [Acinetobacter sp. MD2(2019)]MEB3754733.1 phosphomannomutase/phosphoglucomutase [Acinetobacter sp. MD2(2019)]